MCRNPQNASYFHGAATSWRELSARIVRIVGRNLPHRLSENLTCRSERTLLDRQFRSVDVYATQKTYTRPGDSTVVNIAQDSKRRERSVKQVTHSFHAPSVQGCAKEDLDELSFTLRSEPTVVSQVPVLTTRPMKKWALDSLFMANGDCTSARRTLTDVLPLLEMRGESKSVHAANIRCALRIK